MQGRGVRKGQERVERMERVAEGKNVTNLAEPPEQGFWCYQVGDYFSIFLQLVAAAMQGSIVNNVRVGVNTRLRCMYVCSGFNVV